MRNFDYPARLTPERGGGFTVRFRDLPEAITCGESREDSVAQGSDCLAEAIACRITDGLEIPPASAPRGREALISLPAPMAAKAALYVAIQETGMSKIQLARRLALDEKEIRRLLDPRHSTRLARIQEVLTALGKRLVMRLENAA
jgi:antitoxin HicB